LLSFFIGFQKFVEISVAEENSSSNEKMWLSAGNGFKSLQ
jgi:hypothetical protein